MVNICCVCKVEHSPKSNSILHSLPKNPDIREQWLIILKKNSDKNLFVCNKHFKPEAYRKFCDRPLLKKDAIPQLNLDDELNTSIESIENNPINFQDSIAQTNYYVKTTESLNDSQDIASISRETVTTTEYSLETTNKTVECLKRQNDYDESSAPKKRCYLQNFGTFRREDFKNGFVWNRFLIAFNEMKKDKLLLQYKNIRLVKKIQSFKDIILDLKKKKLLTDSVTDMLNKTCSPTIRQLINKILLKKQGTFPIELKQFSCTLHFYSPAAYEYVRKTFMNVLPHQSTIRKWLSSVNHEPGISIAALKHVSELCQKTEVDGKKLYFSLTCDEMAIRKHVEFDGKKWHGFVDVGNKINDCENNTEATNVLVFMLVGINIYFKIVIAYYFIHTLTGKEKSYILNDILHVAHDHRILICNITFDGASTNICMVQELGATITTPNNLQTYFQHPVTQEPITVMLDACHMLKLVRNTLAAKGCFTDINGKLINWNYLILLVNKQEEEGLHLATKIRRRHIYFKNEKMKVKLAAQVFSSSVANALKYCEEDLKLAEFQGATPTAEFCQTINDIFDLLNSRNIFTKKYTQRAICAENLKNIKMSAEKFIKYIETLKINNQSILETKNKTGFIGLIICLKSAILLAEKLFAEKHMTFLLTYKLSQDHVETFFASIRRFGGCNNNPTARQFKSALKKLHTHVNINIVFNANCTPKDDILILQLNAEKDNQEDSEMEDFIWDVERDYSVQSKIILSEYQKDILAYIAGFIVKQTEKIIRCNLCIESLKQSTSLSQLQKRKQYGKLINASDDVVKICIVAEHIFRTNENILHSKNILEKLILLTYRKLPVNDLFTEMEHSFNQIPLMDHRNQLIRILLKKFFVLRLHHYAASKNNKIDRIRAKFTKLILFKNQ